MLCIFPPGGGDKDSTCVNSYYFPLVGADRSDARIPQGGHGVRSESPGLVGSSGPALRGSKIQMVIFIV